MEITNQKSLFTICKSIETDEYHVYLSIKKADNKCYLKSKKSICGAVEKQDNEKCRNPCVTITELREVAAKIGDKMCGNCMKSIYKTKE
jgi:hypothetical protein